MILLIVIYVTVQLPYRMVIFVFLTIIQYRVLEHVASMYAAALAQTDRSLHHHHGYSRCHTDMDIHPSTEKMMHQGLSGFIQKLKELFNIMDFGFQS